MGMDILDVNCTGFIFDAPNMTTVSDLQDELTPKIKGMISFYNRRDKKDTDIKDFKKEIVHTFILYSPMGTEVKMSEDVNNIKSMISKYNGKGIKIIKGIGKSLWSQWDSIYKNPYMESVQTKVRVHEAYDAGYITESEKNELLNILETADNDDSDRSKAF